jgi:diguanylate cyclase (GGDEF)-like protein
MTDVQAAPPVEGSQVRVRSSLRTRWTRGFALMLALSLLSGATSLAVVVNLASSLRGSAAEADRESQLLMQIRSALNDEDALAHKLADQGAAVAGAFLGVDAHVTRLLAQAVSLYNSPAELALAAKVGIARDDAWADLRPVAADPALADRFGHELADKDAFHRDLLPKMVGIEGLLAQLDTVSRAAVHNQISDADRAEHWLVAVLGMLLVVSAGLTLVLAQRLRREVLAPISELVESANRFASGGLDHRIAITRSDEFGHLGEQFNKMAASIAASQQHLTTQAHYDNLTGLLNRARFLERIDEAIERTTVSGEQTWIGFVDLDDFKLVNDSRGHDAGDEVLRRVANVLLSTTRPKDLVARLGGDEFAVLLGPGTDEDTAELVAQRIVDALGEPLHVFGEVHQIGASIGLACRIESDSTTDDLIRRADDAMYTAKGRGKNRWERYDAAVHGELAERRAPKLRIQPA